MLTLGWREQIWACLDQEWDLVIVGGGITGAGILREAARAGLRVLLVEAGDFASGTSSRSSKLVHGGFRYLRNGQVGLTLQSVRERERLLEEGRGLVNPLGFLMANYEGDPIPGWVFGLGLIIYDLLALKWGHRHYDAYDMRELCPTLSEKGLQGGYRYFDAQTDDARLVLRVLQEARMDGGIALNYARAMKLLKLRNGVACGVLVQDEAQEGQGRTAEVKARMVINATGAWVDELRQQAVGKTRMRKLRGSHLILPSGRLPLSRSISFLHPKDGRPVFAVPWEGITIVGTTDVEHDQPMENEPKISTFEAEYLLEGVRYAFPHKNLKFDDVQATFAGVRPVIDTGKADPCKESREHALWNENGLLTVTGGKLTTFRLMAHEALMRIRKALPGKPRFKAEERVLADPPGIVGGLESLAPALRLRLLGRHGAQTPNLIMAAQPGEMETIENSATLWAEVRWAARAEGVVHLDDLLLRRTRLGLLLPQGATRCMERIRSIAQAELGWDDLRWMKEVSDYTRLWNRCYHLSR